MLYLIEAQIEGIRLFFTDVFTCFIMIYFIS